MGAQSVSKLKLRDHASTLERISPRREPRPVLLVSARPCASGSDVLSDQFDVAEFGSCSDLKVSVCVGLPEFLRTDALNVVVCVNLLSRHL